MTGTLITLPLRVWLRSARVITRAAGEVAGRAASLAGQTIDAVTPDLGRAEPPAHQTRERDEQQPAASAPARPEPPRPEPSRPEPNRPEPNRPEPRPDLTRAEPTRPQPRPDTVAPTPPAVSPTPPAPVTREDVHVSEEPELVRELAEPGAEDGAGAAITVAEPWSGYRHMNAHEVITRARRGSRAELAAVRLYESRHRRRQTVLAAVDRQLKLGNGADQA